MATLRALTEEEVKALGLDQSAFLPHVELSYEKLLTVQFAKCINYLQHDTDRHWGGQTHEDDIRGIEDGYSNFLAGVSAADGYGTKQWLRKERPSDLWGPDNFRLCSVPADDFGLPYEAYISLDGAITTTALAARVLAISERSLVHMKCSMIVDRRVLEVAVKGLALPKAEWPAIPPRLGGKGGRVKFSREG